MPYLRMAYPPAPAGRMTPAPITVTARAAVTTTVTSSVAVSAVQAGLMDPQFAGPRAPIPGAYAVQPGYLADHQYHLGPAFEDPSGVGMYGFPGTGYAEVGAVGGVPNGAVGYMGPSGRSVQDSLGGGAGAVPHYCLLYTSPSPRDRTRSRMPSSA